MLRPLKTLALRLTTSLRITGALIAATLLYGTILALFYSRSSRGIR